MFPARKEPLTYLKKRYEWTTKAIVTQRLTSHLIPMAELKAGDYEGLSEETRAKKIKEDYEKFLAARAELVVKAVQRLTNGEDVTVSEIL